MTDYPSSVIKRSKDEELVAGATGRLLVAAIVLALLGVATYFVL